MPAYVIEDPMTAAVRGAGVVLENIDEYAQVLVESEEYSLNRFDINILCIIF